MQAGEHEHVVEGAARSPGSMSIIAHVGWCGSRGGRGPRVELDGAVVGHPRQRGGRVEDEVQLGLAGVGVLVAPASEPVGGVRRRGLVPEAWLGDAVGEAVQVHRPVGEVRQHRRRDRRVVADQVALGQRRMRPASPGTAPCRGWSASACARRAATCPDLPSASSAASSSASAPTQSERARPAGGRRGLDLVVGPAGLHRPWVVLGIPARRRRRRRACAAAAIAPCCRRGLRRTSTNRPLQLLAVEIEVQVARLDRGDRIVAVGGRPRAPVPHDDVAAAVLAAGITPSKSKYSSGWSSTCTAMRFTSGSSVGPFGTAQLISTPSASSRRS